MKNLFATYVTIFITSSICLAAEINPAQVTLTSDNSSISLIVDGIGEIGVERFRSLVNIDQQKYWVRQKKSFLTATLVRALENKTDIEFQTKNQSIWINSKDAVGGFDPRNIEIKKIWNTEISIEFKGQEIAYIDLRYHYPFSANLGGLDSVRKKRDEYGAALSKILLDARERASDVIVKIGKKNASNSYEINLEIP